MLRPCCPLSKSEIKESVCETCPLVRHIFFMYTRIYATKRTYASMHALLIHDHSLPFALSFALILTLSLSLFLSPFSLQVKVCMSLDGHKFVCLTMYFGLFSISYCISPLPALTLMAARVHNFVLILVIVILILPLTLCVP